MPEVSVSLDQGHAGGDRLQQLVRAGRTRRGRRWRPDRPRDGTPRRPHPRPARPRGSRPADSLAPTRPLPRITLDIRGELHTAESDGNGPVDATFNAIKQLVPHNAILALFQIHAVTEGTDAQAEVTVRLEENGKTVTGQAAEADTILASARAYVSALNKLLNKREKTAPEALSA